MSYARRHSTNVCPGNGVRYTMSCMIVLDTDPASIWPGKRTIVGTRQPPSQLVFFSPRKGVDAASGQVL